jgi:5,10-methenyltetrahydrofolate synthetase
VNFSSQSADKKRQIRDDFLKRLSLLTFHDLIGKSGSLSERFFEFTRMHDAQIRGAFVVSFCPFGNEPQINIEKEGAGESYRVAYVRVDDWASREMSGRASRRDTPDLWEEFNPGNEVRIYQPVSSLPLVHAEEVAAILVPAVAFSREGARLGRGAGFYDRFLRKYPAALRVGVAFSEQLAPSLPEEEWDERVDVILTDQEIITMNSYGDWTNHGKINHRNHK